MWKLKIAEGGNPWLQTVNGHVGRQIWEFDPKLGSPEEIVEIEKARENFRKDRFQRKHSADLLMRIQVRKRWHLTFFFSIYFLSLEFLYSWRLLI